MRNVRIHLLISCLIIGFVFLFIICLPANSAPLSSDSAATQPTTAPSAPSAEEIAVERRFQLNAIEDRIASLRALLDQMPADQRAESELSQRLHDALANKNRVASASDAKIAARINAARQNASRKASPATMKMSSLVPATQRESIKATPPVSFLDAQVIFPGSESQGQNASLVRPMPGCELVTLHATDGTRIVAMFGKPSRFQAAGAKATVIYFYGNGSCMANSLYAFNGLRGLGFHVIMVDYEGYGMSGGTPSELGCYASADAAYDYLLTRGDVDRGRVVAVGWSLGAAVAIDLASRRQVAGLVTFSALTNLAEMSQYRANGFPLSIFVLSSRFDNLAKIGHVPCPIFMVHGTQDPLVPPAMLDRLVKGAGKTVATLRVPGAHHNDIFQRGGEPMFHRVKVFIDGLAAVSPTTQPK